MNFTVPDAASFCWTMTAPW